VLQVKKIKQEKEQESTLGVKIISFVDMLTNLYLLLDSNTKIPYHI